MALAVVRPDGVTARIARVLPFGLLAGLVVLAVPLVLHVSDQHHHDQQRAAAVTAARVEVSNLMNISAATAVHDLGRILAGATGNLRRQIGAERADADRLTAGSTRLTGSVVSAGLLWLDEARGTARAVVAADGTDTSAGAGSSGPQNYRWVVTLRLIDGRWLVADAALEGAPS